MTVQDLKQWNKSREEDVWWIRIEGETLGRKVNLEKIEQILDQKLDSEVMVLHVSQATQRPRPWVEMERVKAAPVEKPRDSGLDGKETNGAYSGEREPRPAHKIDVVSGPVSQSSENAPENPQDSIDMPPFPTPHFSTGKLDPSDKKVSFECTQCGRVAKYLSDEFPFRVGCRSCGSTHSIEKVEVSSWQFSKVFFGHLLLLSLPALLWAYFKNRTAEAEAARTVARMFGKDAHYFSTAFIGSLIAYIIIYSILTFWVSLIFFNQGLRHYNLSRFDGFKSCVIKYGGWVCVIFSVLAILVLGYVGTMRLE